jgi:hypothetical protein
VDARALLAYPVHLLPMLLLAVKDENADLATKALATAEQVEANRPPDSSGAI